MNIEKTAAQIVKSLLENDDLDDLRDVEMPPEHTHGIHDGLFQTLVSMGVTGDRISTRYSDVHVSCRTWQEAKQIAQAGPWKSMAEVVRMNPEHPDAREFPWLVDIPFGNLAGHIADRTGNHLGESEAPSNGPFNVTQGTVQLFISNISGGHDMDSLFVPASMANYDSRKPVASAWEWAVAEKAVDILNDAYRQGQRDFTENSIRQVIRQAEKAVPYVSGNRPPPEPPKDTPATAEEKAGAELIQMLQSMAGIEEPFEKALRGWRSMSDEEKQSTRSAASFFGARKAKHSRN